MGNSVLDNQKRAPGWMPEARFSLLYYSISNH